MNLERLKKYFSIVRMFRNGLSLIQAYRNNDPIGEAILWSGQRLIHPPGQGGFVGTILELWIEECYTSDLNYKPSDGDVILDVGAHVGLFSIWCVRQNPRCRVTALEANRDNHSCLISNLSSVHADGITPHFMALGGERGYGKMEAHTDRSIDHQLVMTDENDPDGVPVTPLEGLFEIADTDRISFLKMDVEGAERDAFAGASDDTIRRIERIAMEYHDNLRPNTLSTLKEKLQATHDLIIHPTEDRGYGVLIAKLKTL